MLRLPLFSCLRDGFTRRVFLTLAIPLLLLSAGFAGVQFYDLRERLTQGFLDYGRAQVALLAHAARVPLFAADREGLDRLAQGLLAERAYCSVRVFDARGELLVQSDAPHAHALPAEWPREAPPQAGVQEGAGFFELWLAVPGSGPYRDVEDLYFAQGQGPLAAEPLGYVGVLLDRAPMDALVFSRVRASVVQMLLFLVVAGLVTLAVVGFATRPLRGLLQRLRELDPQVPADAGWSHLEVRFSTLLAQVGASFETIHSFNQALEARVAERTSELAIANAELERARDHLEDKVRERTAQLERTHNQLCHAEKLTAVGRLAASLAHEFNNPICGVRNCISELRHDLPAQGEAAEIAGLALAECDRMAALVNSLRQFSRPSLDLVEPVRLSPLLDAMVQLTRKQFEEAGIRVVTEYGPELPPVCAAQDPLKQVFLNLLQNARDAMDGGGGTVTLRTRREGDEIRVEIADQGSGIARDHLEKIFEPFFSTKDAVKGTGLGLSVSHGIVKRFGGRIEVTTEPGRGSTFTVCLPALENAA